MAAVTEGLERYLTAKLYPLYARMSASLSLCLSVCLSVRVCVRVQCAVMLLRPAHKDGLNASIT
jgi:hypothetical protein